MERSAPTVAVIIPTYNRAHFLRQALDSVLQQTRPPDEVIVVDDGSTDGTAGIVAAYGTRVHYMRQENAGKPAALNRALSLVRSDYVCLMDDDDVGLPDALEKSLAFLSAHPDIDFSYGANYEFSGEASPTAEYLSSQQPEPIGAGAPESLFIHAMLWFPFYLQGMLVPRRCYNDVGVFNESLTFSEDYDMILRLARRFRGGNTGTPTCCIRVHPGLRGPAAERHAASEREVAFREYEHRIFARLHASLPLAEYLPRGAVVGAPDSSETRQARLQRACIMSRHGLFEDAFVDLRSVLDASDNGAALSWRERQILADMLGVEAFWLRIYPHYASLVGRLLRQHHADRALAACAKGLGWRLESSLRHRRYRDAKLIAAQLWRLVGMARLPTLIAMVLGRRYREALLSHK